MRLTGVAALAAATAALCASCASAVRPASAPATGALSPGLSSAGSAAQPTAGPVARQGNVRVPGCSTAVARAPRLTGVRTAMVPVAGDPFAVAPAGRWSFVSVPSSSIIGFRAGSSLPPTLAFSLPVTSQALGEAITHDGRYLLAASASGVLVIGVARAEHGSSNAVLGSLTSLTSPAAAGAAGAIEVAVSRDDRFAFVSLEDSDEIAVFDLNRALTHGFGPADFVGTIPVGEGPVGMAASPDGQWLYATSEVERGMRPSVNVPGTLSVINLHRAETDPAGSVVSTVVAGCGPVRVITSASGSVIWVTARESDALLAFSAARLRSDPARSLIAQLEVGEAPVGLALVSNGRRIVVADSNRFGAPGAASSLAVVSVAAALAGQPALLGFVGAGQFPREMALEPGGKTLLVTNFGSQQLEAVDVADLP